MVYKKIKLNKGTLSSNTLDLDPQVLANNGKTNKYILLVEILIILLFTILFAMTIKLQFTENKKLYDDLSNQIAMSQQIGQVVSCYYDMPLPNLNDTRQLMPSDIHPHLCTHINIAFAKIKDLQIHLEEYQQKVIMDVLKLKELNPSLKILLSIGGAGGNSGFSDMVVNHSSRKVFIRSIKHTLRNYSLDGVDLDWEFPAIDYKNKFGKRERQHFSQLLREIRMEYIREKTNYLLTVAVAAQQIIVDVSYDVDQINMYADFVNLMTYDFHTYTKFTPMTGFNSPLYSRQNEQLYLATLNVNYTVDMYINKGLDRNKIVVGIPTYGHSFTLRNVNNANVGSPVEGFGKLGISGFVNYPDICAFLHKYKFETTIQEDSSARVPYFYRISEWVSYDTPKSVAEKAKYIRDNKLRGAMIYSLNADDYDGLCDNVSGMTKFPLAVSIKNTLNDK